MEDEEYSNEDYDGDNEAMQQEMLLLNEIFSRFKDDPEQDYIGINHLGEVLQALGRNPSLRDAELRTNQFEAEGKHDLTLEDVIQLLNEPWTVTHNDREALRRALERMDQTKQGYIDIDKFRTFMSTMGEPLNDEELNELVQLGLNDDPTMISIDHLLDQLLGNNA